jgi:hypothetical protein
MDYVKYLAHGLFCSSILPDFSPGYYAENMVTADCRGAQPVFFFLWAISRVQSLKVYEGEVFKEHGEEKECFTGCLTSIDTLMQ